LEDSWRGDQSFGRAEKKKVKSEAEKSQKQRPVNSFFLLQKLVILGPIS